MFAAWKCLNWRHLVLSWRPWMVFCVSLLLDPLNLRGKFLYWWDLTLGTNFHHLSILAMGYRRNLASWRCWNPLSLADLKVVDLGFLSGLKLEVKSPSRAFKFSRSSLAMESRFTRSIALNASLFWSPGGLFSTGQIVLRILQFEPSSSELELSESDLEELEEDEED